ncbi:MAG: hypothetical protein DLM57_09185 [Pseudonocardiales bacterium]|nr:MAG: hypothetical protein DLM57_09185 [Pseudonocardiales bacterium]
MIEATSLRGVPLGAGDGGSLNTAWSGLEGRVDGSHRPRSCPHQMPAAVEVALWSSGWPIRRGGAGLPGAPTDLLDSADAVGEGVHGCAATLLKGVVSGRCPHRRVRFHFRSTSDRRRRCCVFGLLHLRWDGSLRRPPSPHPG